MKKLRNLLTQEHQGAVAFEYIIILVIMAVAIFTAFRILTPALEQKAGEVAAFIQNNGQGGLNGPGTSK